MLQTVIKYLVLIIAGVLTILVLWQGGRADGLTSAITGSKSLELFANTKSRGTDKLLDRLTLIATVLFLGLATIINLL